MVILMLVNLVLIMSHSFTSTELLFMVILMLVIRSFKLLVVSWLPSNALVLNCIHW